MYSENFLGGEDTLGESILVICSYQKHIGVITKHENFLITKSSKIEIR